MLKLCHSLIILFYGLIAQGQGNIRKPFFIIADFGVDHSIGSNQTAYTVGILNDNYSLSYYSWERFQNPSLRLRGTLFRSVRSGVSIGVQSGITARFQKMYNQRQFWVAIPLQLRTISTLQNFYKATLKLDLAAGIHLQQFKPSYENEVKSGALFSAGFLFLKNSWTLRVGYEYQNDKATFRVLPDPNYSFV